MTTALFPDGFEEALGSIHDRIRQLATSKKIPGRDPDDVAQEIRLILVVNYRDKVDRIELLKIAHGIFNKIRISSWREKKSPDAKNSVELDESRFTASEDDPELSLAKREIATAVAGVVRAIGEPCRSVIHFWMHGTSSERIRETLNMPSTNAVDQAVKRCKKKLREMLGPVLGTEAQ